MAYFSYYDTRACARDFLTETLEHNERGGWESPYHLHRIRHTVEIPIKGYCRSFHPTLPHYHPEAVGILPVIDMSRIHAIYPGGIAELLGLVDQARGGSKSGLVIAFDPVIEEWIVSRPLKVGIVKGGYSLSRLTFDMCLDPKAYSETLRSVSDWWDVFSGPVNFLVTTNDLEILLDYESDTFFPVGCRDRDGWGEINARDYMLNETKIKVRRAGFPFDQIISGVFLHHVLREALSEEGEVCRTGDVPCALSRIDFFPPDPDEPVTFDSDSMKAWAEANCVKPNSKFMASMGLKLSSSKSGSVTVKTKRARIELEDNMLYVPESATVKPVFPIFERYAGLPLDVIPSDHATRVLVQFGLDESLNPVPFVDTYRRSLREHRHAMILPNLDALSGDSSVEVDLLCPSPWNTVSSRVLIHYDDAGFHFLFLLRTKINVAFEEVSDTRSGNLVFLAFGHHVDTSRMTIHTKPKFPSLGDELSSFVSSVPFMGEAIQNAMNAARGQLVVASKAGFDLRKGISFFCKKGCDQVPPNLPPNQMILSAGFGRQTLFQLIELYRAVDAYRGMRYESLNSNNIRRASLEQPYGYCMDGKFGLHVRSGKTRRGKNSRFVPTMRAVEAAAKMMDMGGPSKFGVNPDVLQRVAKRGPSRFVDI
jgi:hypothetical protein